MAGYTRYALLRMVPQNGDEETLDLMSAFTDAGGPVRIAESHEPDDQDRDDINRRRSVQTFGFRGVWTMDFQIIDMTDQFWVKQIMDRSADSDEWALHLSVDGGTDEYEVVVTRYQGPRPLGGKTVVGAGYSIRFESADLLDAIPQIGGTPTVPSLTIPPIYSLPTATVSLRGRVYNYIVPGSPDRTVVCQNDGSGGYAWQIWSVG